MILSATDVIKYIGSSSLSTIYEDWIPAVVYDFFDYTYNYFENDRVCLQGQIFEFSTSGTCTVFGTNFSTWHFASGDNIRVCGSIRNDGFFAISTITNDVLTISTDQTLHTELRESHVKITKMDVPESAKMIMSQMIKFRMENTTATPKSESLGDYSITYGDLSGGYPEGINNAMNKYVNARFL
jgi:hypothetical protein